MPPFLDKFLKLTAVITTSLVIASPSQAQAEPATTKSAPTPAELIDALRNKPTRAANPATSTAELAEIAQLITSLKDKTTRGMSISTQERQQLASVIATQPAVNLEIGFQFNSSKLKREARDALKSLGTALKDGQLATADILIAGHTDAKGRRPVNQWLSERRAAAVRAHLIKSYGLSEDKLISVGYGSERLKNPTRPYADENRRVQIVNLTK